MGTIAAGEPVWSRRPRSVSIYQSLLGNLAVVIVLLSGAIMALTFIGSRETVERLSGVILRETIRLIDLELRHFFEPVIRDLGLVHAWDESGLLDREDAAAMNRLLVPLLRANSQLSAVMVADERGREHIVFHFGDVWSSRQTRRDVWGARSAWLDWTDARPEPGRRPERATTIRVSAPGIGGRLRCPPPSPVRRGSPTVSIGRSPIPSTPRRPRG